MKAHARVVVAAVVGVLLVTACSEPGSNEVSPGPRATSPTSVTTTGMTTTRAVPGTVPDGATDAAGVLSAAVDAFAATGSYAFDATVTVVMAGEPTEISLEGWVEGADRELVMRAGADEVTTRVVDGVATVHRDGTTTEVALRETDEPPSLEILKSLHQPTFATPTEITGQLSASDLRISGFEFEGSAEVAIHLTADRTLTGYTMTADNGSWSVRVRLD